MTNGEKTASSIRGIGKTGKVLIHVKTFWSIRSIYHVPFKMLTPKNFFNEKQKQTNKNVNSYFKSFDVINYSLPAYVQMGIISYCT